MRTIYKYFFKAEDYTTIAMHKGAEIVRVEEVNGKMYLWAIVDTKQPIITHIFNIFDEGVPLPETKYIVTWRQGPFVWHMFKEH